MSNPNRNSTVLRPAERGLERFNKHRQERTVVHWFTWRHLRCKLQETRHYISHGWTMLQLEVIASRDTPCPVTTTGYLAHFLDAAELARAGGAIAFMRTWMDREASAKAYQAIEFRWRQGDLFDHAALREDAEEEPGR
ncbi:MAG: hypothetical protein AB7O57_18880 [Hyphomicrobiaceae bacterium]